jgi:hypothetical protein
VRGYTHAHNANYPDTAAMNYMCTVHRSLYLVHHLTGKLGYLLERKEAKGWGGRRRRGQERRGREGGRGEEGEVLSKVIRYSLGPQSLLSAASIKQPYWTVSLLFSLLPLRSPKLNNGESTVNKRFVSSISSPNILKKLIECSKSRLDWCHPKYLKNVWMG